MTAASDNIFPKLILVEGAAPASPAASDFKLYVDSSDHLLKMKNSAGTVTTFGTGLVDPMTTRGDIIVRNASNSTARLAVGGAGTVLSSDGTDVSWQVAGASGTDVKRAFVRRNTGGNYTLNNNSTFAVIDATNLTATVAAATSDVLMITMLGRYGGEAVNAFIDVATIVSGSPVNYISGGTGASTDFGVEGWLGLSGVAQAFGGAAFYTVQAGDISGGNVTLRPYYRTGSAAGKTLNVTSANNGAMFFGVINLRQ